MTLNRRTLALAAVGAAVASCAPSAGMGPASPTAMRTRWKVRQSEGFDALYFMGPLAGDPFLAPHYEAELAEFKPRLPASVIAFLEMGDQQAKSQGAVLSAVLSKFFSMGPDESIDALVASLDAAETLLKPRLQASDDWGGDQYWAVMMQVRPPLRAALIAMRDAGFAEFRRSLYQQTFEGRSASLTAALSRLDVIPEVERLLGLPRDPEVEIIVNYFDYPRSQRLFGQRFITHHSYSDETLFWIAGHELLHPPFDRQGAAATAAVSALSQNPFVVDLITRRNPGLGMRGDMPGYFEECCTQALDHLVSERLGMKRDSREYWSSGEHNSDILAACIFGLLQEDRYGRTGGRFETWLGEAVRQGRFAPASLNAAGTRVLGAAPQQVWRPYVTPA